MSNILAMLFADKATRSVDANIVRLRAEKEERAHDAREAGKKPAPAPAPEPAPAPVPAPAPAPAPAATVASQARLAVMLATGAISQEVFDVAMRAL
jgi:pyruvate/2-oxoglutarate dehydrogenase complex dihydrolipoamide acyltransferase (E2) component